MQYFFAVGIPFILIMIFGPALINILKKFNFGQQIRAQGPESHLKKEGIPTMGGILILIAIILTSIFILKYNRNIIMALIIIVGMGLIGFLDDFIKIKKGKSLGLKAREKIITQILLGLILAFYVYNSASGTGIIIPGRGEMLYLGKWVVLLIIFTVIGTVNAVNLTDGLDGLAAGVTAVVASSYTLILSVLGMENLSLFAFSITGACLGFMWYNSHPAQVFMGDVGSLALGGAIAALAVLSRTELYLLIIGGVYVLEALSVIIQVIYFRLTGGNRVFRMTPIHHHYELRGITESKIVSRFIILSLVFALLGLILFYINYV